MTERIAALAEALNGTIVWAGPPVIIDRESSAAAILAALDSTGWRLHARDKTCPHEAEIARLRKIEEAARALADPTVIHNGRQYDAKMAALRAALEAE